MKLSLQTDFSLRTLMYLAMKPGRRNVAEIAQFFQISAGHVAKVVNHLSRMGYIRSIRGVGGGIELAKSPEAITIGEIVAAVEGDVHLLDCVGMDNVCVIERTCKLKGVLAQAERIQRDYLNSVRLSDVLPFATVVPLSLSENPMGGPVQQETAK
jgi:Rrf2 family transcriptional regulator, nitric oxide-sensitive transcriptional repressor